MPPRLHKTSSPARPNSTAQVTLLAEIAAVPDVDEFGQLCQKRSRTPDGAVLLACLALQRLAESPKDGLAMLPHCLHPSFFEPGPDGDLRLRPAEHEFLISHLYGRPERIRSYFKEDASGVKIEISLDNFCGDPVLFGEIVEADRQQRQRPALDRLERAGSRRNLMGASRSTPRSLFVLMSRSQWSEPTHSTSTSELPVMVELRQLEGRWYLLNWYALLAPFLSESDLEAIR